MSDIFNEESLRDAINKTWGPAGAHMMVFDVIYGVYLKNLPSNIDNRQVKCDCNKNGCKVGLNFDSDTNDSGITTMLLTDKNGNETAMQVSKATKQQIIEILND